MTPESPEQFDLAFDTASVVERFHPSVYRYVLRLVGDPDRAEDLTQETFLRVHQRLGELRDGGALQSWIYRIATNVCYDQFRRREYRRPSVPFHFPDAEEEAPLPDEVALRPDQLVEQNGMSECVADFLARLPENYRAVLLLHDLHGYSDPEIAAQLGLSHRNVKVRLHRARARLKVALTEGCNFSHDDRGVFVCEPKRSDS